MKRFVTTLAPSGFVAGAVRLEERGLIEHVVPASGLYGLFPRDP